MGSNRLCRIHGRRHKTRLVSSDSSPTRRVHGPGSTKPKPMAWRPYDNLIDGELDNRTPGKVTGWLRFFRNGMQPLNVQVELDGDFHDDIRGSLIRLSNPNPREDDSDGGTYMEGFDPVQRGTVGDITAGISLGQWTEAIASRLMQTNELAWDEIQFHGSQRSARRRKLAKQYRDHIAAGDLYYPYVEYPYFEWYSSNGRVVLELDPSQVEIVERTSGVPEHTAAELLAAKEGRDKGFATFLADCAKSFAGESGQDGGSDAGAD